MSNPKDKSNPNSSAALRSRFLEFFAARDHEIVPSSPLVPAHDPTLLFTNAGMVQFKETFLGRESRACPRAASSQRCVRAGGKHNDLENVGYTARHHTFFEMLGNFSFGDYFKREAIRYAWTFLTEEVGLPPERLWVTVFEEDDEAADLWLKDIKVDPARFSRIGAQDNFWSMGDTGPCGPCTEIFYDHGSAIPGGVPGSQDAEGDRYVEVWNLVFMQYDRDQRGNLEPLPKPSVDTGMGLERLAAILQGVHDNYEIDLFQHLIRAIAELTGDRQPRGPSYKVIADHIRSCAFLVTDGVLPSNEGRGYVLRRIIRRAARHGHKLGLTEPFFYKLTRALVAEMGAAFPELAKARTHVERVLKNEETRFAETLEQGMRILENDIASMFGAVVPGDTVFKLYDTFGFPVDLTNDIARERGLTLDMAGFEGHMAAQRERARAASHFGARATDAWEADDIKASEFTGYDRLTDAGAVTALLYEGTAVARLTEGQEGAVFLDRTPFYAESGGQVGDAGVLDNNAAKFNVRDTSKHAGAHAHLGTLVQGSIAIDDRLAATVDAQRRQATVLNHSATHLLHAALRQVLGEHVTQKGSLVAPDRLRFDFSHPEPVNPTQLDEIETLVNDQIRANAKAEIRIMEKDEALVEGAMALFGEKYGKRVRVLKLGEFSTELCGGTHVRRAGDIGVFRIVGESGVASGIRRIEALTGRGALAWQDANEDRLDRVAELVKGNCVDVEHKVRALLERNRAIERELEQMRSRLSVQAGADLASKALDVNGVKVLTAVIPDAGIKSLRETLDQLKSKLVSAAIVLAAVNDDKVTLVAGVTKEHTDRIKAGELVNMVAVQVGGKGGGRPDMAQAGGNDPAALDAALRSVPEWVRSHVE
ncbi:MAG: alanine--tRNA ligase [Gammaproteobacteria bacterium]|nr:alanine--tRNA ligase [Gammaproteobacteria bacterium]